MLWLSCYVFTNTFTERMPSLVDDVDGANPPPQPLDCPAESYCRKFCPNGFVMGLNGCRTCTCSKCRLHTGISCSLRKSDIFLRMGSSLYGIDLSFLYLQMQHLQCVLFLNVWTHVLVLTRRTRKDVRHVNVLMVRLTHVVIYYVRLCCWCSDAEITPAPSSHTGSGLHEWWPLYPIYLVCTEISSLCMGIRWEEAWGL